MEGIADNEWLYGLILPDLLTTKLIEMTNANYIQWLETMIIGCDDLGGMEREKAIYQNCLKKARNLGQTLPIQRVMPSFDSPKNWTEDYKHENGNYICRCSKCKEYFYGHKRRPLCKECSS